MTVVAGPRARAVAACIAVAAVHSGAWAQAADVRRGEYLAHAGGCAACHTDEGKNAVPYAGGRAIETPFGVFYGPNITPHPEHGIGRWSRRDFFRAMREGVRPDGEHYYPSFPYPYYTGASDRDLGDLWAYLQSLPQNGRRNRAHELGVVLGQRFMIGAWKRLYFSAGRFVPDRKAAAPVNRGAYLVQSLGHCGACHTPRSALGGPRADRPLAGVGAPDGKGAPNLTPTGLEKYSDQELTELLATGVTPEGDVLAGEMDLVIRYSTGRLTPADRAAIVAYLRSLPPLPSAEP